MAKTAKNSTQGITGNRLLDSVLINYDALDWTVGFCRKVRSGTKPGNIEGWILCQAYMRVLGLDVAPILQDLSASSDRDSWAETPPLDFWRRAILKVACRMPDGRLEFCRPGMKIPPTLSVDHILFTPDPAMIPYCDITEALMREGKAQGIKLCELLFQFNGKVIRSANSLADMVLNRDMEPCRVCDALDRWRDGLAERIIKITAATENPAKEPKPPEPEAVENDNDFHTPQSFQGQMVPGSQLARYLKRTSKTLRRWDKLRMVPTGKKWTPGIKVSGNVILYELAANWPAIQSMIRRDRDERTDKQLAHELGALAADACDWSEEGG